MLKITHWIIIILFISPVFPLESTNVNVEKADFALLLIDIQDFYFPGGKSELEEPEKASLKAAEILSKFREKKLLIVHIRHDSEPGGNIHKNVRPLENEKIINKKTINAFKNTGLLEYLQTHGIKNLIICGMMTHMCVEAATRAGKDLGFNCTLIHDACATKAISYKEYKVSAKDVHLSTLGSLSGYYAKVMNTETFLREF